MKILLVIHEFKNLNSGAAGSTLQLGENYQKLGHEVSYFSLDNLPDSIPALLRKIFFPIFVACHIASTLKTRKIDIIDASTGDAWIWAKVWRSFSAVTPVLVTRSHGLQHLEHIERLQDARSGQLELSWKYPLYRGSINLWEIAASLKSSDLIFLLNQQEAEYAIKQLSIAKERVHVFPNGIPDAFIGLPFDNEVLEPSDTIRIAQIGTYLVRKGVQYSAPALNRVLVKYPRVQLNLLGTGAESVKATGQRSVEEIYAEFDTSVRDRITVIPSYLHSELPHLLKDHHIKLFTPISEGFGKALIEAMACGLAPVVTESPGPLDVISNGDTGLMVPCRDTEAIEQALTKLIKNHQLLAQIRQNAYLKAQSYSWKNIAKSRLDVYEKAISMSDV